MSNGKGSARRPRAITSAEEADRWHATFAQHPKPGDIRTFVYLERPSMRHVQSAPYIWTENPDAPGHYCWRDLATVTKEGGVDKRDGSGVD